MPKTENQERHKLLADIVNAARSVNTKDLIQKIDIQFIFQLAGEKGYMKRWKAMSYLDAAEYIKIVDNQKGIRSDYQIFEEGTNIILTEKGIKAYSSEYFLEKYKERRAIVIHNSWMIACNVTVAIAAIIALWVASKKEKIELKPQQINISIDSSLLYSKSLHTPNRNKSDSATNAKDTMSKGISK